MPIKKCHSKCRTCYGSGESKCTSCPTGTYYYNPTHQCLSACPLGTVINGNICDNHCAFYLNGICYNCNEPESKLIYCYFVKAYFLSIGNIID